jgi:hypothetical protein
MVQKFWVTISEDKVINIKNNYYEMDSYFLSRDIGVKMASRKIQCQEEIYPFCHTKLA